MPRRPARLLEVEQDCSSLACHFLLSVVCCALVCSSGALECWGGRQGGCGPELCVRLLRVCGSQLAVCLVSLFLCLCVARACRHHLSSVHPYRVGVQSEPGCSSPFYLPTYLSCERGLYFKEFFCAPTLQGLVGRSAQGGVPHPRLAILHLDTTAVRNNSRVRRGPEGGRGCCFVLLEYHLVRL